MIKNETTLNNRTRRLVGRDWLTHCLLRDGTTAWCEWLTFAEKGKSRYDVPQLPFSHATTSCLPHPNSFRLTVIPLLRNTVSNTSADALPLQQKQEGFSMPEAE